MKKLVASVGLVALGASSLQVAQGQDAAPYKPWNISASLRGFYDDNINTVPNGPLKQESFGFQISPGASLNWQSDQTVVQAGYIYTMRWYEERPFNSTDKIDQNHTFDLNASHTFSERMRLSVTDSFVVGQEPDLLRYGYALEDPQRVPGDNIRNFGTIDLTMQITPLFGAVVGYKNAYFAYDDDTSFYTLGGVPSQAARLNRIEQSLHLDGRWQLQPETVGVLGYQYAQAEYTESTDVPGGNGIIGINFLDPVTGVLFLTPQVIPSNSRNYRAHYAYLGVDHNFRTDLSVSARGGIRYTDYYNANKTETIQYLQPPNLVREEFGTTSISPYALINLRYTYGMESYAEIGFSYDRNATDLVTALDQESAVLFGTVKHRILANLFARVTGHAQHSTFKFGNNSGGEEETYLAGLSLQYRFNTHLSGDVGYNYEKLDSSLGRGFSRNRVYIGVTGSY